MKTKITIEENGNSVVVSRERKATNAERKKVPGAKVMAEVVTITFGDRTPRIIANCDLCA